MSHQIIINVADEIYLPLVERAQSKGKSAELMAAELLAEGLTRPQPGSLISKWFGAFDSGVSDAAERHDDYIGQALYDELKGK